MGRTRGSRQTTVMFTQQIAKVVALLPQRKKKQKKKPTDFFGSIAYTDRGFAYIKWISPLFGRPALNLVLATSFQPGGPRESRQYFIIIFFSFIAV